MGLTQLRAGRLLLTVWSWPRFPLVRPRLHLLFDFGRHHQRALSDHIVLQAEEISDYAWLDSDGVECHLFPAQVRQLTRSPVAERIWNRDWLHATGTSRDQNMR